MGTQLATARLSTTPEVSKSLSQRDREEHRGKIAFEVLTVLSAYFQPQESDAVKAAQLSWWCDELEDWHVEQVVWALRKWNSQNPDKRPTPGHISGICKQERGRQHAAAVKAQRETVQERERVSADAAQEILSKAGFRVNRFGGVEG